MPIQGQNLTKTEVSGNNTDCRGYDLMISQGNLANQNQMAPKALTLLQQEPLPMNTMLTTFCH
jgi:hypothetical protein